MKTLALCSLMAAIALTGTTAAADFDETKKPLAGDLVKYESLAIASGRPYETIIDGNPGAFLIAAEPVMKDGTCMSGGDANGALSLPETCTG